MRAGQIVVIAASREDARRIAELSSQAWQETAELADRITSVHRQPNFALRPVQVLLADDRAGALNPAPPAVSRIGRSTQVMVGSSAGTDDQDEQQRQLRQAIAQAFFQVAQIDQQLPPWVSQGLAAYVGGVESAAKDGDDRAARVKFLMDGNDGRHAGPFFDLLREQLATVRAGAGGDDRPTIPLLDEWVASLEDQFQQWQADPATGQPLLVADDVADDQLRQAQKELLVALKFVERFSAAEPAAIRTKVTTFDNGRSTSVSHAPHASRAKPASLRTLLAKATAAGGPSWTMIGPEGKLIGSDDEDKLRALLGMDDDRYQHAWQDERWVLTTQLADGRQLAGWLESNRENPQRPLAKFTVAKPK